jgi:signal transduction histidine kinase
MICCNALAQNQTILKTIDSIHSLRALSKNETLELKKRLEHAKAAQHLAHSIAIDSVTITTNFDLADAYWDNRLFSKNKTILQQNLYLSYKNQDSLSLSKSHQKLGQYHRVKTNLKDSALYHLYSSKKIAIRLNYTFGIARALFDIAVIQKNDKDFANSEANSFKALALLKTVPTSENTKKITGFIYNNLGQIYDSTDNYLESITFYEKALKVKRNLKSPSQKSIGSSLNNLGVLYRKTEKYNLAYSIFDSIFNNEYFRENIPDIYVTAMGNRANTLFLSKKFEELPYLYYETINYINLHGIEYRLIATYGKLAEYHHYFQHKDSAKYYAYKAKDLAQNYYTDDVLESLLTLSKVEDDSIAVKHYDAYIKLSDSLLQEERNNRNKYARIEFETDTYIADNKQLIKRNTLISTLAVICILTLILLLVIRHQRAKNKTLRLEKAQQQASADIYSLMLNAQDKMQEGRLRERYHIAEELHDGVLNTLAGTRLSIEYLSSLDHVEASQYQLYIKELHKAELDIRDLSHALKHSKLDQNKGFVTILEEYVSQCNTLQHFTCTTALDKDIPWLQISDMVKVNLFRCIQEALQNTAKHAYAKTVRITLTLKDKTNVKLTIADDGNGFDPNKIEKGIGLDNMKARANRLKGNFKIDSKPHKGTTLIFVIPI